MSPIEPARVLPQIDWQPTAGLAAMRARAKLLSQCRNFFAARNVLEVETPVLSRAGATDPNIESFRLESGAGRPMLLNTSPEFAMKRLLAAGSGDIFQVCKAFRSGELGSLHNPEFTLLEWYREGFDQKALMREVAQLLAELFSDPALAGNAQFFTYAQLFEARAKLNPLKAGEAELLACLHSHEITVPDGESDRDALLDLIMAAIILPTLQPDRLSFICDYPISQAALARAHPENPLLAKRFEVVLAGAELANGFEELNDAHEQRDRFMEDCKRRAEKGAPAVPIDANLLAALAAGMGEYAGVALGLDRVLMLILGAAHIDEVLCFPVARA